RGDAAGLDDGDTAARATFIASAGSFVVGIGCTAALRPLRWLDAGRGVARWLGLLRRGSCLLAADREDLDPFGQREHRREGVFPGEVQVVAAAMAGVAVVADPAEGGPRAVLEGLGPVSEAGYRGPGGG